MPVFGFRALQLAMGSSLEKQHMKEYIIIIMWSLVKQNDGDPRYLVHNKNIGFFEKKIFAEGNIYL